MYLGQAFDFISIPMICIFLIVVKRLVDNRHMKHKWNMLYNRYDTSGIYILEYLNNIYTALLDNKLRRVEEEALIWLEPMYTCVLIFLLCWLKYDLTGANRFSNSVQKG